MTFIYIIGGLLCLLLAVFFIDRREKMNREIKHIREYRQVIEQTNHDLDEVITELESLQDPLSKLNDFSKKVLSYMKKA